MFHSVSNCIHGEDLGSIKLTLSEPETLVFTRSVITQAQANQEKSMEEKTYLEFQYFVVDLKKELTDVLRGLASIRNDLSLTALNKFLLPILKSSLD